MNEIHVYGADWCPDCRRAKRFFEKHSIPYTWHDTASDPEAARFVREANEGGAVIPTIVFPDGSMLMEPSTPQLIAKMQSLSRGAARL